MPVSALFNEPDDRELELLEYFEKFGESYPFGLNNMNTPRFAKTAVMLEISTRMKILSTTDS